MNINEIRFKEGKRHQAGMTVPEDFFVKFQANLEEEIDKVEPQKLSIAPVASQRNMFVRWMSVAACACLIVGVGLFALNLTGEETALSESIVVAEAESENEYSETEQLILSSFDDLYLYDLYCDMY